MHPNLAAAAMVPFICFSSGVAFAQATPDAAPAPIPADAAPPPVTPPTAADGGVSELKKQVSVQEADNDEQDARIEQLERKIRELEKLVPKPGSAGQEKALPAPGAPGATAPSLFKVSAYAQGQYESHQDSEDQLAIGGAPLNQNRFVLRRARVKVQSDWTYGGLMLELDANTVHGPAIGVQHAEISLAYRDTTQQPFINLTIGIFDNPFGREVVESPRDRPFMERSFGSREFFPAEPDLGLRLSGQVAWFRYAAAVVNGQPLGDRSGFILQDPNSHKDVLGRIGIVVLPAPVLRVSGGVSVLNGKGFHAGSDPTKNTLIWKDSNEDGQLNLGETRAAPGAAGIASQNFDRWAVGADLELQLQSRIGTSTLAAEVSAGSNMGRNVFVADPVTTSVDERELGYYVSFAQELAFGGIVGFRYDTYNPDADFLDSARKGKLVPSNETVTTYAPLLGFQIPHHTRLVAEYDVIRDAFARDAQGVPTDLKNDAWFVRLQGEL